jgi:hypothetical protein
MLRFNFFVWFLGVLVLAQDPSVFKMEPMESDQPLFVRRKQEITEGISAGEQVGSSVQTGAPTRVVSRVQSSISGGSCTSMPSA